MALTENLITTSELAAKLSQTERSIRDKAKAGSIPAHYIAGEWRFSLSEVLAATRNDYPETTNNDKAEVAAKEEG